MFHITRRILLVLAVGAMLLGCGGGDNGEDCADGVGPDHRRAYGPGPAASGECTAWEPKNRRQAASLTAARPRAWGSNQQHESAVNRGAVYICTLILRLDRGHDGTTHTTRPAATT
jgi:hypothetical protein